MAGNVWEWVQDEYISTYTGAPIDGSGRCADDCPTNADHANYDGADSANRVLRGGNWGSSAYLLRAAHRGNNPPSDQNVSLGGRLARSID